MRIKEGEIIPGERISDITLGMTMEQLLKLYPDYNEKLDGINSKSAIIKYDNAMISLENNKIQQIGVMNDFKGSYNNLSIGTEVGKTGYKIYYEIKDYTSYVEGVEGICLEITDDYDDNMELERITHIFVYKD